MFRRGLAHFALKDYDAALKDLKQAAAVAPNNKAVLNLMEQVNACRTNYNDQQKRRLAKLFRKECVALDND